jgi:hypothetical protein
VSHFDRGQLVSDWEPHALRVFGGFRAGRRRWVKTPDGWDAEFCGPARVYASEAEALKFAGAGPPA